MNDQPQIRAQRIGSIWHGTVDGFPEIDERGLTPKVARAKAERELHRIQREQKPFPMVPR